MNLFSIGRGSTMFSQLDLQIFKKWDRVISRDDELNTVWP